MDKKYQIFISSTYLDMKDERQAAVESILDAGHIPAGMELFAASDKKQIEVIKGWIDRSDIFMLILGGRYGSVEPESGKSYIQLEYEYAVETKKPHFALYLTDGFIQKKAQGPLGLAAIEQDDTRKLKEFRALVKGKLCSEVDDLKDIRIQAPKAIRERAADGKLEGWVRASSVPDMSPLLVQLQALQHENAALKGAAGEAGEAKRAFTWAIEGNVPDENFQEQLRLEFSARRSSAGMRTIYETWTGTCLKIFLLLASKVIEEPLESTMQEYVNRVVKEQFSGTDIYRVAVLDRDYQNMKMKLVAFDLISLTKVDGELHWALTEMGKATMMKHHAG
ncbi:DUF4062 domain-containing protein [Burkholderia ambifaria]|uniref:DUF4062 domain-containing protein n=1 Tax=Burkholderia ambifaria TaxID=152480 RepID=UPI00158964D9|nr:DUF4062 domain-containing protein [Burkholderia ambifaria]WDR89572.1 DUF4062 domain-containing protein [Burkholderia ambifaria]WDS02377.1 DUF4062 domain-containing protein [Burkholderia ambifaria]